MLCFVYREEMWQMQMHNNKFLIFLLWIMEIRLVSSFTSSILCARIPGLTPRQRLICSESPDALIALGEGHQLGAHECQYQFRGYRWNCSHVWQQNVFAHVVFTGSREAAFTYAIASAGAAHAVTAACARGNITMCGCDMRHKSTAVAVTVTAIANTNAPSGSRVEQEAEDDQPWKWGGCSADIDFGMRFARKFMDAREIEADARSVMNLHNNRVGRTIVKKLLRTECKCHGVSGSCVMKTCWKSLPPFRLVGDVLMRKYHRAKSVDVARGKRGLRVVISRKRHGAKAQLILPKRLELVYLQSSPNYCERSVQSGTLGTVGRLCNRTTHGPRSCDLLCCGRGYNTQQIRRAQQCRCQFRWCCQVECEICEESFEQYTCK